MMSGRAYGFLEAEATSNPVPTSRLLDSQTNPTGYIIIVQGCLPPAKAMCP